MARRLDLDDQVPDDILVRDEGLPIRCAGSTAARLPHRGSRRPPW